MARRSTPQLNYLLQISLLHRRIFIGSATKRFVRLESDCGVWNNLDLFASIEPETISLLYLFIGTCREVGDKAFGNYSSSAGLGLYCQCI